MKHAIRIGCLAACSAGWIWAEASKPTANPSQTPHLDITVNTENSIGPCYRYWTVRVLTHQSKFVKPGYLDNFKATHPYTESINCVRVLGGRSDNLNEWFKGTNPDGSVKADFSGLMPQLRALLDVGITPGIVLDNVPHAMSSGRTLHKYGNSNPPDDFDQWHAYITAFVNALVAEFGIDEVKTWRFRVGTEPDLLPGHWVGTREQYFEHYAVTVDAVTRILPDADIGPGNILNPAKPPSGSKRINMQLTGDGKGWGVTLIDHLAETKTRATFFAFSHYSRVNDPIQLEESVRRIRDRLELFPELRNLPLEIHESGVIADENKRRINGSEGSEWGASWYAAIADIAYREGISKIYDWGYTASNLPIPRQLVIEMLDRMAGGRRLEVSANGDGPGDSGAIAVRKDSSIFLLLYHHQAPRTSPVRLTMTVRLEGGAITASQPWVWDEWTVDREHGVFMREFYRDCEKAGVKTLPNAPNLGIHFRQRFGDGWAEVLSENVDKYQSLAFLQQTASKQSVIASDGALELDFELPAHTVKLIELKVKDQNQEACSNIQ